MAGSNFGRVIPRMLDDLRKTGVREGDCLIVHSSFKALGLSDALPVDAVRTLIEAVGEDGTIMTPTFTYSYSGIWNVKPFNPQITPGRFMGVLSETLRLYPGALRSASPTYSVAAYGKYAGQITDGKEKCGGLGVGSSYEEAYNLGARILLLGVGNNRNSMIHYAEVASGLPYTDIPFREFWGRSALVERDGEVVEVPLADEFPGCSANFGVVDGYLEESGGITRGKVCDADSMLMDSHDLVDAIVKRLHTEPSWLFCDALVCEPCHLRKRRLREKGLI